MNTGLTICVVTGSRADYGLLSCVMREIAQDADLGLQVLVTGMHLSEAHGSTWKDIIEDGFEISARVPTLDSEGSRVSVARATGTGITGCAEALAALSPDLVVVLGDRYETFAAAAAATFVGIPIAHFHGGETTEGAFDEPLRHSITKMSHLHFTATDVYRNRVIQLGESPERVFNVGAVGLDNIARLDLLDRSQVEAELGVSFRQRNLMVTFHPVTLEPDAGIEQVKNLIEALGSFSDCSIIVTTPNADPSGGEIEALLDDFVASNPNRVWSFKALGALRYLSTLGVVDVVVGNSSSGLIEAPSIPVPAVNIGDRQRGRISGPTVIDCPPESGAIQAAIEKAMSQPFLDAIRTADNPYGSAGAARRAVKAIKQFDLSNVLTKSFYDLGVRSDEGL